jgi:hypothetical protein
MTFSLLFGKYSAFLLTESIKSNPKFLQKNSFICVLGRRFVKKVDGGRRKNAIA